MGMKGIEPQSLHRQSSMLANRPTPSRYLHPQGNEAFTNSQLSNNEYTNSIIIIIIIVVLL